MSDQTAAARIAAYLRAHIAARATTARVGPFLVAFDQHSDNRYRNYALPENSAEPTLQEVQYLINTFEERRRVPRLEYMPELAPAVLPVLVDAGFRTEGLLPVMVCSNVGLPPQEPIAWVSISMVSSDVDLESAARVQNEAYGEPNTSPADVARLRSTVSRGGAVALARDTQTGEALGSALYSAPVDGATEIAALGVRSEFRRRGIGSGLTTALARHARGHRIDFPFLMAAHDSEASLYRRLGFSDCGTILHISR